MEGQSRKPASNGAAAEKLQLLVEHLHRLIEERFTGHVKVNFSQGGIGRIEKYEEILKNLGKVNDRR